MAANSSNNDLLLRFKDAGQNVEFIAFSSLKLALALVAQLFSASLIYVTWKTKSLRETCNLLIAANCLVTLVYMLTFAVQFLIAALGLNFVPMRVCFPLMAVPIFMTQSQNLLYLALAIDRLLTVLFPIWHIKNIQKSAPIARCYLAAIFGSISVYSAFIVYTGVDYAMRENRETLVACSTPDPLPTYVVRIPIFFNLVCLLCYLLLWLVMRKKQNSSANSKRRILNSILVVFGFEFCGWFSNYLIRNILLWFESSALVQWYVMNLAGLVLIPSLAMYAPVLYVMSKDYSRAFHQCFGLRFPFSNLNHTSVFSIVGDCRQVRPYYESSWRIQSKNVQINNNK